MFLILGSLAVIPSGTPCRGGGGTFSSAEVSVDVYDSGVVIATAGVPEMVLLPTKPGADGKTRLPIVFSDLLQNDHGRGLTLDLPLSVVSTPGGGQFISVTPGYAPPSGAAPVGYEGLLNYETSTLLQTATCSSPCSVTDWVQVRSRWPRTPVHWDASQPTLPWRAPDPARADHGESRRSGLRSLHGGGRREAPDRLGRAPRKRRSRAGCGPHLGSTSILAAGPGKHR